LARKVAGHGVEQHRIREVVALLRRLGFGPREAIAAASLDVFPDEPSRLAVPGECVAERGADNLLGKGVLPAFWRLGELLSENGRERHLPRLPAAGIARHAFGPGAVRFLLTACS